MHLLEHRRLRACESDMGPSLPRQDATEEYPSSVTWNLDALDPLRCHRKKGSMSDSRTIGTAGS